MSGRFHADHAAPYNAALEWRTVALITDPTGQPADMKREPIPDFNDTELSVVRETVRERFRDAMDVQAIEGEVRIDPSDRELTPCPGLYWRGEGRAQFVLFKTGESRYRCQFFYRVHQQYGTGKEEYDDIGDCVITLLQVQADHAAKEAAQSG
jgi:hypothetical protein